MKPSSICSVVLFVIISKKVELSMVLVLLLGSRFFFLAVESLICFIFRKKSNRKVECCFPLSLSNFMCHAKENGDSVVEFYRLILNLVPVNSG